jgi:hypothetical protein
MESAHFFGDAGFSVRESFEDADGEATQSGDVGRAVSGGDARAVFVEIPVDEVVAAILDDPVSAIGGEDVRWIGLLGSVTGDAKGVLDGDLAGLLVQHFAVGSRIESQSTGRLVVQWGTAQCWFAVAECGLGFGFFDLLIK